MVNACAVAGQATSMAGRADDDKIAGDRDQVVEGLGRHQLVEPLVVFLAGQPALRVRGAKHGGHLLAIGIGGTEVATSNGTDVAGFRDGLGHHPKLVRRSSDGRGPVGPFRGWLR